MFRRTLVLMLAGLLLSGFFGVRPSHAKGGEIQSAEQARAEITRLGTGREARAEVKLRDGVKLKGHISGATEDSFTITDSKTGTSTKVAYADVIKVSKQGGGLSTLAKVIIGAAVAGGVVVAWQIVKPAVCDGGAQTRGPC